MNKILVGALVIFVIGAGLTGCSPLGAEAPHAAGAATTPSTSPTLPSVQPSSTPVATLAPTPPPRVTTHPITPKTWIVSGRGIGPIRLGMTADQLRAVGIPHMDITTDYCLNGVAIGSSETILSGGTGRNMSVVGFVSIADIDGPHTSRGIGVGSTLREALAAYPGSVYLPGEADSPERVRFRSNGTWVVLESTGTHGKSDRIDSFTVGLKYGHPNGACP